MAWSRSFGGAWPGFGSLGSWFGVQSWAQSRQLKPGVLDGLVRGVQSKVQAPEFSLGSHRYDSVGLRPGGTFWGSAWGF